MKAPVRVLHAFSTFNLGGPQSRFITLHKALGNDFHHYIIAMDGQYGAASECDPSACTFLKANFDKGRGVGNSKVVKLLIQQYIPDVVISYNWGAIEWQIFSPSRIRRVHVEDGFSELEHNRQFTRRIWLRRILFQFLKLKLVVVSNHLAEIAKTVWLAPPHKILFIANGVDTNRFHPSQSRKNSLQKIGIASGLRPEKRIDRLLNAFALLKNKNMVLNIAGDGTERDSLEKIIIQLGLEKQVELLGHLKSTESFYQNIDCFVLCSDTEQAPFSLLEAMASGLPCVVTRVGDMPLMLPDANKNWVCDTNPESLSKKLDELSHCDLIEIGNVNRNHILDKYSLATMQNKWDVLLQGRY